MHPLLKTAQHFVADPRPDRALLADFAAGRDPGALAELLRRHARAVRRVAAELCLEAADGGGAGGFRPARGPAGGGGGGGAAPRRAVGAPPPTAPQAPRGPPPAPPAGGPPPAAPPPRRAARRVDVPRGPRHR